jgi:hypothetical protein
MNLFILDSNPVIAAQMNCDKHVVKIILEACQMLSTAHHFYGMQSKVIYSRPSYTNHPVTTWVRASVDNYKWTVSHAIGLCDEYNRRYHKRHNHVDMIQYFADNVPPVPNIGLTPFAQAMPDRIKNMELDAVTAYRLYYALYKSHLATWNFTRAPDWYTRLTKPRS